MSRATSSLTTGSVLHLAQTLEAHNLLAAEREALARLSNQIHARWDQTRAVANPSDEYSAAAWLTTRAYIASALEGLSMVHPVRTAADDHVLDPPTLDEPGLN